MKLMIPIFHTKFDVKKLLVKSLGGIPPSGDFGGFLWLLWLLKFEKLVFNFSDYHGLFLHSLVVILAYAKSSGKLEVGKNLVKNCATSNP